MLLTFGVQNAPPSVNICHVLRTLAVIIKRYVIREIAQTFAAVLVVLILIFTAHRFVRYLADAAAGKISAELILELVTLKLLASLALLLPVALYVAVLLALGRLHQDSEVIAMGAGGIGLGPIAQSVLWLAGGLGVVVMALTLYISPQVAQLQAEAVARAREESEITDLFPGRFKALRDGQQIIYVEEVAADGRAMYGVFVQMNRHGRHDVLVAERARQSIEGPTGHRYIVLEDGHRYTGAPGDRDFVITRFERHAVLVELGSAQPEVRRRETLPTLELISSDDPRLKAELHWRLALPLTVVLLALLAVPLSRTSPRQGKYAKLFTAFLVYFAYSNALGVGQNFIERGEVPSFVGLWPVHLLMTAGVTLALAHEVGAPWYRALRRRLAG